MMDNETTIQLLQNAIDKVPELLSKSHLRSSDHIQWISDTLYLLEEIFGDNSRIYISFASLSWQPSGIFFARHYEMERELEHKRFEAFQEQLQMAIGLLSSGIEQIKRKGVKNVYEGKDTKPKCTKRCGQLLTYS